MTTETLIKKLRRFLPPGPLAQEIMMEAATRLELIEWELTQTIAEVALLKQQRDEAREMALTLMEAADSCEWAEG